MPEPIIELPVNEQIVIIKTFSLPGYSKEAKYFSANQIFVYVGSDLRVRAYDVVEWEPIP